MLGHNRYLGRLTQFCNIKYDVHDSLSGIYTTADYAVKTGRLFRYWVCYCSNGQVYSVLRRVIRSVWMAHQGLLSKVMGTTMIKNDETNHPVDRSFVTLLSSAIKCFRRSISNTKTFRYIVTSHHVTSHRRVTSINQNVATFLLCFFPHFGLDHIGSLWLQQLRFWTVHRHT